MPACTQAVELGSEFGGLRDARGLARALIGDFSGAIEDFQAFIAWVEDQGGKSWQAEKSQRQRWIKILHEGKNPFTPELIKRLSCVYTLEAVREKVGVSNPNSNNIEDVCGAERGN